MKAFLMHKDRDFDLTQRLPANAPDLVQDLELDTLFGAMACGDEFLLAVVRSAVLGGLGSNLEAIRYRQDVLKDCLRNASIVRQIYDLAVDSMDREKKI